VDGRIIISVGMVMSTYVIDENIACPNQDSFFLFASMSMTCGTSLWLRNHDPWESEPSKSLGDQTQPGPHQPLTGWIFWCLLPSSPNLGNYAERGPLKPITLTGFDMQNT